MRNDKGDETVAEGRVVRRYETGPETHASAVLAPEHVHVHIPGPRQTLRLLCAVLADSCAGVVLPALAGVEARHERVGVEF